MHLELKWSLVSLVSMQLVSQGTAAYGGPMRDVKNKAVLCKPLTLTKATYCKPHMQSKLLQTGERRFHLVEVIQGQEVPISGHLYFAACVHRCGRRREEGVHSCPHPRARLHPRAHEHVLAARSRRALAARSGENATHRAAGPLKTRSVNV